MLNSVIKEVFYQWFGGNRWLFHEINSIQGGREYDQAMVTISSLADSKTMFLPALSLLCVVAVVCSILNYVRRVPGPKYKLAQWVAVVCLFAVAMPVNAGVNHILKDHFGYERPYAAMPGEVHQIEQRAPEDATNSFPSGHAAFAACFIFSLWEKIKKGGLRVLALLALFAVMWSRVALGVHFPADVFWSAVISLMVVCLVRIALYMVLTKLFRLKW